MNCRHFRLFPLEQLFQAAQQIGSFVNGDFGLDAFHHFLDHIIRQIHAQQLLDDLYGLVLELCQHLGIFLDLFYQLIDLRFDVHGVPP